MTNNRDRDIILQRTTIGPHLDDLSIHVICEDTEHAVVDFLSRGENKTLLLGLQHLSVTFVQKHSRADIIVLFDDLFSELDTTHIQTILDVYAPFQVFITTQPNHIPDICRDMSTIKLY